MHLHLLQTHTPRYVSFRMKGKHISLAHCPFCPRKAQIIVCYVCVCLCVKKRLWAFFLSNPNFQRFVLKIFAQGGATPSSFNTLTTVESTHGSISHTYLSAPHPILIRKKLSHCCDWLSRFREGAHALCGGSRNKIEIWRWIAGVQSYINLKNTGKLWINCPKWLLPTPPGFFFFGRAICCQTWCFLKWHMTRNQKEPATLRVQRGEIVLVGDRYCC